MPFNFHVSFLWSRRAILLIGLICGLSSIIGCSSSGTDNPSANIVVTRLGSLRGYSDSGASIYKGIPYASPPVGDLRWRAPQDPTPWIGVRDATKPASACTQEIYTRQWNSLATASNSGSGDAISSNYTGSEDCLYLDVYKPQNTKTSLPVYVFIHGGSNNKGDAQVYDGTTLAVREKMIVVVIQYRLNALGWFSNYALKNTAENALDASGNYGTLDQIKALTWVKNNISSFGGDPTKVTIGGQSAGANAVINMIMSPLTDGLFSKAVALSPAMSLIQNDTASPKPVTLTNLMIDWLLQNDGTAADMAAADTYRLGMSAEAVASYLRGKPALKILEACIEANLRLTGVGTMPSHSPYMDGNVLPATDWVNTIKTGSYHHVPLIIGNAEYEMKSIMPVKAFGARVKAASCVAGFCIPSSAYDWSHLESAVLNTPATLTLAQVLPLPTDLDIYGTGSLLSSAMWKATYTDAVADALMTDNSSSTIYVYLFQWNGGTDPALANFKYIIGASHGTDVPFWFGYYDVDLFGYSFTDANRPGRVLLMNAMMDYLGTFVHTGNPNKAGSGLAIWSPWTARNGGTSGATNLLTLDANTTSIVWNTPVAYGNAELTQAGVTALETAWASAYGAASALVYYLVTMLKVV